MVNHAREPRRVGQGAPYVPRHPTMRIWQWATLRICTYQFQSIRINFIFATWGRPVRVLAAALCVNFQANRPFPYSKPKNFLASRRTSQGPSGASAVTRVSQSVTECHTVSHSCHKVVAVCLRCVTRCNRCHRMSQKCHKSVTEMSRDVTRCHHSVSESH